MLIRLGQTTKTERVGGEEAVASGNLRSFLLSGPSTGIITSSKSFDFAGGGSHKGSLKGHSFQQVTS